MRQTMSGFLSLIYKIGFYSLRFRRWKKPFFSVLILPWPEKITRNCFLIWLNVNETFPQYFIWNNQKRLLMSFKGTIKNGLLTLSRLYQFCFCFKNILNFKTKSFLNIFVTNLNLSAFLLDLRYPLWLKSMHLSYCVISDGQTSVYPRVFISSKCPKNQMNEF